MKRSAERLNTKKLIFKSYNKIIKILIKILMNICNISKIPENLRFYNEKYNFVCIFSKDTTSQHLNLGNSVS